MLISNRKPICLFGAALQAAETLIDLKQTYARKRAEILARYEQEMADFASVYSETVEGLFNTLHKSTKTVKEEGWIINGSEKGIVMLVPVVSDNVAGAMIARHDDNSYKTH